MTGREQTAYQKAVDSAEEYLADGLKRWIERQRKVNVVQRAYLTADTFRDEDTGRASFTGNGVQSLLDASTKDPEAFDALTYIICELLRFGTAVPEPLSSFAIAVLQKSAKRPNKSGRYSGATDWRDMMIAMAVFRSLEFVPNAVHDDSKNGLSACGAVAEALERMGETPSSYRHVKAIWERFRRPRLPLEQSTLDEIAAVLDGDADAHAKNKAVSRLIQQAER